MSETAFFDVSTNNIRAGIRTARRIRDLPDGSTEFISEQVGSLVENQRPGALLIQAGKFIIDATLASVEDAATSHPLPEEIYERTIAAVYTVDEVAHIAANDGSIAEIFGNFMMLEGYTPLERAAFIDEVAYSLATVGSAPLTEASVIVGGAALYLRNGEVKEPIIDIVARSPDLLEFAKVHRNRTADVLNQFGMPYALPDCFEFDDNNSGRIAFSDVALAVIEANAGSGCPAGGVTTKGEHPTLLHQYWAKITGYLLRPGFTTDLPITRRS